MLTPTQQRIKRIFDLCLAMLMLPVVIIPIFLLFIIASFNTNQNGFFVQKRVGKNGDLFCCYKLRSLKGTHHLDATEMKANETKFGGWLRKSKLDELPQIYNVLKGDMSFVGPRPDVPGYADQLIGEDRIILKVRPGITGPATLKYRNEDDILLQQENPNEYNDNVIWPDKIAINKAYIKNWSLKKDISYLLASIIP